VSTGGGSLALAFADLVGDGSRDVVVVSRTRGTAEVLVDKAGVWELAGSYFAGGAAVDITTGRVQKKDVLAVRDENGSVALLERDTMPHRLDFPVQVYRRFRNQAPVDNVPPARSVTFGDLDQDGESELVVASQMGITVVEKLPTQLAANPEKAPVPVGYYVEAGPSPQSVAATDVDGDKLIDLVAVDSQAARVYTMRNVGGRAQFEAPRIAELPATATQVIATGCKERPAAMVLSSGALMAIDPSGAAKPILPSITGAKSIAAAGGALLIVAQQGTYIYDACASFGSQLGLPMKSFTSLAVADANGGVQSLAVLTDDKSVSLMRVFSGF
jgi:hypothetical protein